MKITTFQGFVLGLFVVFLIAGVAAFALFRSGSKNALPPVVIWGTLPEYAINQLALTDAVKNAGVSYTYIQKDPAVFESQFVNALASGNAPDLAIFPNDLLIHEQDKLLTLTTSYLSERTFRDTFVDGAEAFWTPTGAIGYPFTIDPLIMYYNRDMFSSKNVAVPPKNWDEFYTLAPKFNEKNDAGNLKVTLVALGEQVNIQNFKELFTGLVLQAGDPIVARGKDGALESVLGDKLGYATSPTEAAIRFYTQFSNPQNPTFSWNKSLLNSRDAFVAQELATYFGFGSELQGLRARNPNLNFDVTTLPQIRDTKTKLTYGRVYGFVIPRTAKNPQASAAVAAILTSAAPQANYAYISGYPPARRDLLSAPQTDPFLAVTYASAIMAHAWLDPSPADTLSIFQNMIESVISGKSEISEAVARADSVMNTLLAH